MSGLGSTEPRKSPRRRPRLNPFVFPSDTTFRFALLVTAVLGANLYVWNWIYFAVGDTSAQNSKLLGCLELSPFSTGATDIREFAAASNAFSACVNDAYQENVWWMLGGTAGLLLVAVALVLLTPYWLERRRRLVPLSEEDAPSVLARLRELVREAGLEDHEPRFVWNPLDPTPTGLAYGHLGRYSVALTGGLVTRQISDPPAFDAVVRHELAHIRNRDVDTTYTTLAIWYAFLAAAVVPFLLTLLDEGGATMARLSWRLLALALLVYLTRNAVLRSREVYADVRASIADGREGGLRRVLEGLPKLDGGWATRLRRLHPDPAVRLRSLDDTRSLFRFGPLVAFGSGVAATIAFENVVTLLGSFDLDPIDMRFIAALAFAPFAVGVVGYGIWRATFAATAEGRPGIRTLGLGLALAAGFLLGPELSLVQIAATGDDALLASALKGEDLLWAGALVLGLVLLTGWLAASAAYWLRSLGNRPPRLAAAISLLAAAGVLSTFMAIFYIARDTRVVIDASAETTKLQHAAVAETAWAGPVWLWQALMDPGFLVVVQRPFIPPALVLLWALPLAAAFFRGRQSGAADWAFLEKGAELRQPRLALRVFRPLAIGLASGLAFWAVVLVLRVSLHNGVAAETRATSEFLTSFFFWTLVLALVAQLAAGVVAAFCSRNPARLIDALAAGFVAGTLAAIAIVGGPTLAGCVDPVALNPGPCAWTVSASFSWDIFRQVVAQGAVASLAGGGLAVGIRALLARRSGELSPAGAPG